MLLFVGAVEILWDELFSLDTSYCLNLVAIAIIAWGATSKKKIVKLKEQNKHLIDIFH